MALLVYKSAGNKEAVGRDCSAGRQQVITVSSIFPNKFVRTHERLGGRRAASSPLSEFDWAKVRQRETKKQSPGYRFFFSRGP